MALPKDDATRKRVKPFAGFFAYFPDAIAAVAELSHIANEKHNPGEPLHWAKGKSTEQRESQARHMLDEANEGPTARDAIGDLAVLHATANAWRAMAQLQTLADQGHNIFAIGVDAGSEEPTDEPAEKFVVAMYRSDGELASGEHFALLGPFDTYKDAADHRQRIRHISKWNGHVTKVIPYQEK